MSIFQVVKTGKGGKVSGIVTTDPFKAIKYLSDEYNSPKNKGRESFIYFKPYYSTVVRYPQKDTKFAIISKISGDDATYIDLSPESLEDIIKSMSKRKIFPGFVGKYFEITTVVNFLDGEIEFVLEQDESGIKTLYQREA